MPVAAAERATFVVPAAFVGTVLHVGRGRPYLAVLAFVVIAAVAPPLLWPAMTTDVVDDLRSYVGG